MNITYKNNIDNSPVITGIFNQTACPDVEVGQEWREKYGIKSTYSVSSISIENGQSVELTSINNNKQKVHVSPYFLGKQFELVV